MDKPIYSVRFYKDGKSHRFGNASSSIVEARELAQECFIENNSSLVVEIVKSYVVQEVIDSVRPFLGSLLVGSKLEHYYTYNDLLNRIEELINLKTRFQYH